MLAYQNDIDAVCQTGVQCPPADATTVQRQAWRFVFSPISAIDADPVAVRNPRRLTSVTDLERCSVWALSMYATQHQSQNAFRSLLKKLPKAKKIIGDHVASVTISPTDGLCTSVQRSGHFDFFPYATTNVQSLMTVSASL